MQVKSGMAMVVQAAPSGGAWSFNVRQKTMQLDKTRHIYWLLLIELLTAFRFCTTSNVY